MGRHCSQAGKEADWHTCHVSRLVFVGIKVKRIDVKLKLSQNRSREDRERVIAGLATEGYAEASATAAWMRAFALDA